MENIPLSTRLKNCGIGILRILIINLLFMKLHIYANVRYWEDAEVNWQLDTENGDNIPCKKWDQWCPVIDTETGIVENWEKWKTAKIHYKVCDECYWELYDNDSMIEYHYDEYMPSFLCLTEPYNGDYIIMNINENWKIEDWNFKKNLLTN